MSATPAKLIREIHPEIRVLDATAGLVQYVASDETLDSYNEVIRADGWRFTHFKKNSPFVDSHETGSIGRLLGKVVDFKVAGRRLIETVQWAKDVPENTLAQLGFRMTEAGYLKAVSVEFMPVRQANRWDTDRRAYDAQLAELGLKDLPEAQKPRSIFLEQEQIELSAVVIGANPNALARACHDGVVSRSFLEKLAPHHAAFIHRVEQELEPLRRSVSSAPAVAQSSSKPPMSKAAFLHKLDSLTGTDPAPAGRALFVPERESLRSACEAVVADPEKRLWLRAAAKQFCRAGSASFTPEELEVAHSIERGLATGDSGLGQAASVCEPLAEDVYSLLAQFGAWRFFQVNLPLGKTKLASVTGRATASWLKPSEQGTTILDSGSLTGASISPECSTVAALVNVSGEVLSDGKTTFEAALLMAIVEGLNYRLDFTALCGDGTDNLLHGGMTGIFSHADVPVANASSGHASFSSLDRHDFIRVIASVAPSALQRECRWFISPSFLPTLFTLRTGPEFLFAPPSSPGEDWMLFGFPIVWAQAAPAQDVAAAKVAAFGRTDAYSVGLRQDFEVTASGHARFLENLWQFRALARARCEMRDATSLATLKLAS